jgi:DNA-directed RNA polymerase subunit H (RpoH/RPB5)
VLLEALKEGAVLQLLREAQAAGEAVTWGVV